VAAGFDSAGAELLLIQPRGHSAAGEDIRITVLDRIVDAVSVIAVCNHRRC
jgi:hypothetical protein